MSPISIVVIFHREIVPFFHLELKIQFLKWEIFEKGQHQYISETKLFLFSAPDKNKNMKQLEYS